MVPRQDEEDAMIDRMRNWNLMDEYVQISVRLARLQSAVQDDIEMRRNIRGIRDMIDILEAQLGRTRLPSRSGQY
jgi:hypothetical protein